MSLWTGIRLSDVFYLSCYLPIHDFCRKVNHHWIVITKQQDLGQQLKMQIAFYLLSLAAPVFALAIPAPKGGGGGGGRGSFGGGSRGASPLPPVIPKTSQHLITSPIDHPPSAHHLFIKTDPPHLSQSGGSYHGYSWSGSSFAAGAFTGYLGGVYVGHGPFHGGADGQQRYREPPPDCVVAQTLSTGGAGPPAADCYYTWEHWHGDNFLMYVIRIAASGQDVKGWSNGVVDNIKGEVSFVLHIARAPYVLMYGIRLLRVFFFRFFFFRDDYPACLILAC